MSKTGNELLGNIKNDGSVDRSLLASSKREHANCVDQANGENWHLYLGDSCEVIKGIPDETIDFCIHSPPFSSLYIYSDSENDMGNCQSDEEFFNHYEFLIEELHRVTVPGRLCAVHCKDLPKYKNRDGSAGLTDFPGMIIRAFEGCGWTYHSRVTIWKDPVIEMQRTKNHGLLHKQLCKDSSASRQGMADYLVVFRKWEGWDGVNPPKPVRAESKDIRDANLRFDSYVGSLPPGSQLSIDFEKNGDGITQEVTRSSKGEVHSRRDMSIGVWQRYASPVWFDIQQPNVLNYKLGRDGKDEKHICLAEGSLVLTYADGYKPIEEMKIGDLVLTHKGRWMPVIAHECTGENREVVTVIAQGVSGLRATPTHKVWARDSRGLTRPKDAAKRFDPEWIESQNLEGCYVNLKLPPVDLGGCLDEKIWWMVGRWIADGSTGTRGDLFVAVGKHKQREFEEIAGDMVGPAMDTKTACQYRLRKNQELMNIILQCGRGASNKRLPPQAYRLPVELASPLLEGYLSGDGHFNDDRQRWYATSVSRELTLGIAFLVQRVHGEVASIHPGRPAGTTTIEGRTVNTKQEWILSSGGKSHSFSFIEDDGAWKKVKSVEDSGTARVWNIRVSEDESYTAEGCVVKNCPLQLDVIERSIHLWTNPGDVVFTPFAGIGSEVYCAVKMDRYGLGIELKRSYFDQAAKNCRMAEDELRKRKLF